MAAPDTLFGVTDFARGFIKGISHHSEVRTEQLAEAVRSYFALPPFPTVRDLNRLCERLGIPVHRLPSTAPVEGVNIWAPTNGPEIFVREDLKAMRLETTTCHEIREVIETAFKRESQQYVGLNTAENGVMNRESDQFAACLLMQAEASRDLLQHVGFDLRKFSMETGRSLPSVVLRLQGLYSIASGELSPHAGIWLFEAPWASVLAKSSAPSSMVARYSAQMCGFSMRKGKSSKALLSRANFPVNRSLLSDFEIGRAAIVDCRPALRELEGFDMFGDHNYVLVVEPIFYRGAAWRLLAAAIRRESLGCFHAWLSRLSLSSTEHPTNFQVN
jgi:hypothetical protein